MRLMMSMGSVEPTFEYSTASLPLVMGGATGGRANGGAGPRLVGVDVGVALEGQTPIRGIPGLGVVFAFAFAFAAAEAADGVIVGGRAAPTVCDGADVPLAADFC